jgi:hypothetical protein
MTNLIDTMFRILGQDLLIGGTEVPLWGLLLLAVLSIASLVLK